MSSGSAAVIVAAGSSTRMGGVKKEYRPFSVVDGEPRTVLAASVVAFAASGAVDLIVVVTPTGGVEAARAAIPDRLTAADASVPVRFVDGGASRRQSVHNALSYLASAGGISSVHIHDGARPWLDGGLIARLAAEVALGAVIPVSPLVETPKEIDSAGMIVRHLKRSTIVSAQTPQSFPFPAILEAHEKAAEKERLEGIEYTDDAEVWGLFVGPVRTVSGSPANRKITFPEDLPVEKAHP